MKSSRYVICVIVAIFIEIVVFNFWNIAAIITNDEIRISVDDKIIENPGYDGSNAQFLYDVGTDRQVYNMTIVTDSTCAPDFYYEDSVGVIKKLPFVRLRGNEFICKPVHKISGEIGISVYGDAKITEASINAKKISFSLARVVAMILIYIAGTILFSIQKMPDYKINDN